MVILFFFSFARPSFICPPILVFSVAQLVSDFESRQVLIFVKGLRRVASAPLLPGSPVSSVQWPLAALSGDSAGPPSCNSVCPGVSVTAPGGLGAIQPRSRSAGPRRGGGRPGRHPCATATAQGPSATATAQGPAASGVTARRGDGVRGPTGPPGALRAPGGPSSVYAQILPVWG